MFETILPMLMLLVPIVVAGLTQFFKSIQAIKMNEERTGLIRLFAVTATFIGMILASLANGESVDPTEVTLYVETVFGWLAIQVPYWLAKAKHKG
jgi:hypothetical protein